MLQVKTFIFHAVVKCEIFVFSPLTPSFYPSIHSSIFFRFIRGLITA